MLAQYVGLQSPMSAHHAVAALVDVGRIVIHDRGIAGPKGGRNVILGLVLAGQTADDVRALGDKAFNVQQQRPMTTRARAIGRRVDRRLRFGTGAMIVRSSRLVNFG